MAINRNFVTSGNESTQDEASKKSQAYYEQEIEAHKEENVYKTVDGSNDSIVLDTTAVGKSDTSDGQAINVTTTNFNRMESHFVYKNDVSPIASTVSASESE